MPKTATAPAPSAPAAPAQAAPGGSPAAPPPITRPPIPHVPRPAASLQPTKDAAAETQAKLAALPADATHETVMAAMGLGPDGAPLGDAPAAPAQDATAGVSATDAPTVPAADRPEWLDPRFKTPEDMAKAYAALEKKLGQPKPPAKIEASKDPAASSDFKLDAPTMATLTKEWIENDGKLTDESYAKLDKAGYPREMVDEHAALKRAAGERAYLDTLSRVGVAAEDVPLMFDWAVKNLPAEEIATLNQLWESNATAPQQIALRQIKAAYDKANAKPRPRVQGAPAGSTVGNPITTGAEFQAAWSDPRARQEGKAGDLYRAEIVARCKAGGYSAG